MKLRCWISGHDWEARPRKQERNGWQGFVWEKRCERCGAALPLMVWTPTEQPAPWASEERKRAYTEACR